MFHIFLRGGTIQKRYKHFENCLNFFCVRQDQQIRKFMNFLKDFYFFSCFVKQGRQLAEFFMIICIIQLLNLYSNNELYVMDYTLHTTNWWTQFKQIVMDPLYAYQDRYHISRDLIQKLRESKFSVVNIDDKLTRIDLPGGNIKPILFARATK
eukprot:TRINITY_DN30092_c0_g1_i1.p2 TRINITY_DN30092_c0_g1~~TRINITY_DN30092_c0_g1_i1.p2  ORF type:complete len:153 (-),score=1.02 TRINITY_DN30092_c0_g1_i1:250-708(-)